MMFSIDNFDQNSHSEQDYKKSSSFADSKKFKIVLGVDYGEKRVGLALMQAGLASPYAVLNNDHLIYKKLKELIEENQVEAVVIGLSEGKTADKTQVFFDNLTSFLSDRTPVFLFDETLSTQKVSSLDVGKKRLRAKKPIDDLAACVILEEWADSH